MKKYLISILFSVGLFCFSLLTNSYVYAQKSATPRHDLVITLKTSTESASATVSGTLSATPEPTQAPRPDFTQQTQQTIEPLKRILDDQNLKSIFPFNFIKYAIRGAVDAGVPPNTIVLLLLVPGAATLIAGARHLIGLRGFGIFLPAALSVVFVATGPIVGIGLFMVIVVVSTLTRIVLRRTKINLQYLPRMALMLQFVVLGILGVLFLAPVIAKPDFANVSIFPVLILVLLAEDFSRVQLGKSIKVALNLTTETLILALTSYIFLNLSFVQRLALLNPEIWILTIIILDYLLGKYVGLRFLEYWRFRKLIKG
jgi:hypothetical protein